MRRRKQYLYSNVPMPKQTRWWRRRNARLLQNQQVQNALPGIYNAPASSVVGNPDSLLGSSTLSPRTEEVASVPCEDKTVIPIDNMSQASSSTEASSESDGDSDNETEATESGDEVQLLSDSSSSSSSVAEEPDDPEENGIGHNGIELYPEDDIDNHRLLEDEQKPSLNTPLSNSTPVTDGDALLMCLALGLRHSLSWAAMVDVLSMVNKLFNCEVVKASKYFFLKYMEVGKNNTTYHLYCPYCERYLGPKEHIREENLLCECGTDLGNVNQATTFFLSLGLENQLKELLKDNTFVSNLNYRFERKKENVSAFEDIYDGELYSRLSAPGQVLWDKHNISYIFNTDGVPIGKSSRQTMWPIYITINELPPHLRSKYMLLVGIYVGKKDPNMKIFLHPFVEEANKLSSLGINWLLNGEVMNTKVVPLAACVDSVARCQMLNMKQFNGYYGCTMCYQKAERTQSGLRYTFILGPEKCRTHESILADANQAFINRNSNDRKKRVCKGVKGPSPLHYLDFFDLVDGMSPDYMHSALLGNIKHLMDILMKSYGREYYIGSEHVMAAISKRLESITPPSVITRTPRPLREISLWKASEWRSWLIFYAVPCLKDILPNKYLVHLSLLSTGIGILLQKSITREQVERAHVLLLRYVFLHEEYYGKVSMVYNVHLLLHIRNSVVNLGPLFAHNAFPFEGQNRHLLQLQKSPSSVAQEVARKYLTFKALPSLCDKLASNESVVKFCEEISGRSLKFIVRSNQVVLIGNGSPCSLCPFELNQLSDLGIVHYVEVSSFQRILHKGCRYTCSSYARSSKINDSYVVLRQGVFGYIEKIVRIKHVDDFHTVLSLRQLMISQHPVLDDEYGVQSHIKMVIGEGQLIMVKISDILGPCVPMILDHGFFITSIPHGCHGD